MAKKLRCYLGLHRYQNRRTDQGERYKQCRDCEKFQDQSATAITVSRRGRERS
jgi:hypothetical protein